jgi:uncharacterized protein YggE
MTSADSHTLISVRAEAQRPVPPDQASIYTTVTATAASKSAASAAVAATLNRLTGELEAHGGQVMTVDRMRAPLTWSAHSMHTSEEHDVNKATGIHGPTGRHQAFLSVSITVRDFGLLGAVESIIAEIEGLDVHSVQWSVDNDNPEWAPVRADAIQAALAKGRDYAAALGGTVTGVEHVADVGLLGGDGTGRMAVHDTFAATAGMRFASSSMDAASLDPAPQILTAIIEARLTATIKPLQS